MTVVTIINCDNPEFVRNGIAFNADNVRDTAAHIWARNQYLQRVAETPEAAAEKLIERVLLLAAAPNFELGRLHPTYGVWVVVDEMPPVTGAAADDAIGQATRMANFFVRPGRPPVLREVPAD